MSMKSIDLRVIGVVAVIVVLAISRQLPWPIVAFALGGGGAYVLYYGWQIWSGGGLRRNRVTYWRGQRIELSEPQRGFSLPPLKAITPALFYLVLGALLFLAGLSIVWDNLRYP